MALKAMPPSTRRQDHGRASSYLLARSHVTYSNERYEDNTLPVGTRQTVANHLWGAWPDRSIGSDLAARPALSVAAASTARRAW